MTQKKSVLLKIIYVLIAAIIVAVMVVALKAGYRYYYRWQEKQALIHLAKAEGFALNNKYPEAAAEYRIIAEKYPRSKQAATAWYRIGVIYTRNIADDKLAENAFEILLKKYPDFPLQFEIQYYLLLAYDRLRKNDELIKISQDIIDKFPGKMDADSLYLEKAEAYFRQGNLEEAYNNVMKMRNKNSPLIKFSQKYHQILIAHNPSDPQPHYALAEIYSRMGLKAKSESELKMADYLNRAIRRDPHGKNQRDGVEN